MIGFGFVYMNITVPLYGLGFFLPQIVKGFGGLGHERIVGMITGTYGRPTAIRYRKLPANQ